MRAAVLGATGDRADEDAVREFYLKTISVSVNRSLEDLASFATEKQGGNSIGFLDRLKMGDGLKMGDFGLGMS